MKEIKEVQLEQKYGLSVATAMVIGIVVGIGIFFKAEAILKAASLNPTVAILAWVLGGTITILAGLTAAELGAAIPETGGLVAYIRRIYGDFAGFMTGWMHVVLYLPGLVAVLAYYTGFFATIFLGIESTPANVAMISVPAFLSIFVINLFMAKSGGRLQTLITAVKIVPLAGLLIFGLLNGSNPTPFSVAEGVSAPFSMSLVLAALVPVMFAYDGWMLACSIGGEVKNPTKNLPKAIIFGLGMIIVLYVGLNIALLKTLPANLLAEQGTVGAANLLFGTIATKAIFGGIVISAYGTLNGLTLAAIRFPYTLAIEGHFPMKKHFSEVSKRFNTPLKSGFLIFVISYLRCVPPRIRRFFPDAHRLCDCGHVRCHFGHRVCAVSVYLRQDVGGSHRLWIHHRAGFCRNATESLPGVLRHVDYVPDSADYHAAFGRGEAPGYDGTAADLAAA